jgi:signal transduction histidine kinase
MNAIKTALYLTFHRLLPWVVLVVLVIYTYAKFYEHPYVGFRVSSQGIVILIFTKEGEGSGLQIGDRLVQVDSIRWADFQSDLRKRLFPTLQPGQKLSLLIEREGNEIPIAWSVPASNSEELRDLLFSEGWLGFFFWMAGTFTLLAIRPKDERWYLLIAFNYLTALWLVIGSGVSIYHIWGSAVLFRIIIWFSVPVYLHLHWVFPQPLGRIPKIVIWSSYLLAGLFAVAEMILVLPSNLYSTGFLVAITGSFVLLLLHPLLQRKTRRDLRFLIAISLTALFPAIVGGVIADLLSDRYGLLAEWISGGGALLGLPLIPFAYLYSAYRRHLGDLEVRVNNFFSVYVFVLLMGAIAVPLTLWVDQILNFDGKPVLIGIMASVFTVMAGAWVYPALQSFVEYRLLGIPLPSKHLLEVFSTQITTSISLPDLIRVLQEDVFPSLLIRQFAFLQYDQGSLTVLSTMGLDPKQLPFEQDVSELITRSGFYRSPDPATADQPYSWIRLVLPLKLGDQLIGFWLLGRRDPDDLYSQQEIPVLSSLANLTSIALSNILQTERLKTMYEANIGRYEQERLRLSRDLHDSILNEMAALLLRSDAPIFSPEFQKAFEALTERLREIVSGLRPPTLSFGLKYALEELAENLSERNQSSVKIEPQLHADGDWRYPDVVENHTYRIVQEASENALKYAHAKTVRMVAKLSQEGFDIQVEDDGIGFQMETNRKLHEMLANKHFGLVGMLERANLIGAEIDIDSSPGKGTCIRLRWKLKESI